MSDLPDISETDFWIIHTTQTERYGGKIVRLADSEIRRHPAVRETASCPTLDRQMIADRNQPPDR